MKKFLDYSKRSLVLLLTSAMIFTSVPADILAAPAAAADDEAIVEEVVEEAADEVAVETPAIADVVDDDAADDVIVEDEEEAADADVVDKDDYTDDVQFVFYNPNSGKNTHVSIYDNETRNQDTKFTGFAPEYNAAGELLNGATATPTSAIKKWDSTQDYTFVMTTDTGYVFDQPSAAYADFNELEDARTWLKSRLLDIYYVSQADTYAGVLDKNNNLVAGRTSRAKLDQDYTITFTEDYKTAVVTIKSSYLTALRNAAVAARVKDNLGGGEYQYHNDNAWDAAIVVAPYVSTSVYDAPYTFYNPTSDEGRYNKLRRIQNIAPLAATENDDKTYVRKDGTNYYYMGATKQYLTEFPNFDDEKQLAGAGSTIPAFDVYANTHIVKGNTPINWGWGAEEGGIGWGWGAQPDVYTVNIDSSYPTIIDDYAVRATYDLCMNTWLMTNEKEIAYYPITGVEVYAGTTKLVNGTAGKEFYEWNKGGDTRKFRILPDGVEAGYNANKTLTVKFLSDAYRVQQFYDTNMKDANNAVYKTGMDVSFYKDSPNVDPFAITGIDKKLVNEEGGDGELAHGVYGEYLNPGTYEGRDLGSIDVFYYLADDATKNKAAVDAGDGKGATSDPDADLTTLLVDGKAVAARYLSGNTGSDTLELIPADDTEAELVAKGYAIGSKSVFIPKNHIDSNMYIIANTRETVTYTQTDKFSIGWNKALADSRNYYDVEIYGGKYDRATGEPVDDEIDLTDDNGKVTVHLYTGRDFTFPVYAKAGNKIVSVSYKQGTGAAVAIPQNDDGTYTLPGKVLTTKTELLVETASVSNLDPVVVSVTDGKSDFNKTTNAARLNLGVNMLTAQDISSGLSLIPAENAEIINTGNGVNALPRNATEYKFTLNLNPALANKAKIKKVSWRYVKTGTQEEFTELTPVNAKTGLYKITGLTSGTDVRKIEIQVELNKLIEVRMPENGKAKIKIDDTWYMPGKAAADAPHVAYVEYGASLPFEAAPTADNVEIKEIGFKVVKAVGDNTNYNDPDIGKRFPAGKMGDQYVIAEKDMKKPVLLNNGYVQLTAQTVETIQDGNTYGVKWTAAKHDPSPAGNFAFSWVTTAKNADGEDVETIHYENTDDYYNGTLRINQNTAVELTPSIWSVAATGAFTGNAVVANGNLDGNATKFSVKSKNDDIITVDTLANKGQPTVAVVDSIFAGESGLDDAVNFEVQQASAGGDKDENLLKVIGEQPVKATPHFEITLSYKKINDVEKKYVSNEYNNGSFEVYTAKVVNGATKKEVVGQTNGAVKELIKNAPNNINPDIIAWSSDDGGVHLIPNYAGEGLVSTQIWADGPQEDYNLSVQIKDTDKRVYTSNKLTLTPVKMRNLIMVPEVTITGGTLEGGRYYGINAANAAGENGANTNNISMGIQDLNKAKISYKVYEGELKPSDLNVNGTNVKVVRPADYITTYANLNTEDARDIALALPMAEGEQWARDVTDEVEWSAATTDATANVPSGLTVTGDSGEYGLQATAKDEAAYVQANAQIGMLNVTRGATRVNFNVCDTTEMIKVNLFTDDDAQVTSDGEPVNHRLSDTYIASIEDSASLHGWRSVNDINEVYFTGLTPEYTDVQKPIRSYDPTPGNAGNNDEYDVNDNFAINENGYQFKVVNGAQFTLPTEADYTTFTDKTRKLVGWAIKDDPNGFGIRPAIAPDANKTNPGATTAFVDEDLTLTKITGGALNGYTFVAPGETVTLLNADRADKTYNLALEVRPVWADRYTMNKANVYVVRGDATEELTTNWALDGKEQIKVTVPCDDAKLGDATNANSLAATISMAETSIGMLIAPVVNQPVTAVNAADGTVKVNATYPGYENWYEDWGTEGTVTWYSFDATKKQGAIEVSNLPAYTDAAGNALAENDKLATLYSLIKKGETGDFEAACLGQNTVLDTSATALGQGILKGKKAGDAYVYASYTVGTGENAVVAWMDAPILVTVRGGDQTVTATIDETKFNAKFKDDENNVTIEEGQYVTLDAGTVSVVDGTALNPDAAATGTFEWIVTPADALEITSDPYETGVAAVNKNGANLTPTFHGLKAKAATVQLRYTSANGVVAESNVVNITVKEGTFTVAFTDKDGNRIDTDKPIEIMASTKAADKSTIYVTAFNKQAQVVSGKVTVRTKDEDVIPTATINNTNIEGTVRPVEIAPKEGGEPASINIGNARLIAEYEITDGGTKKIYGAEVDVKTYYAVKFGGYTEKVNGEGQVVAMTDEEFAEAVAGNKVFAGPATDFVLDNTVFTADVRKGLAGADGKKSTAIATGDGSNETIISDEGVTDDDKKTGVYVYRVYKEDLTENRHGKLCYTIDLSKIYNRTNPVKMTYNGKGFKDISFIGWSNTIRAKADAVLETLTVEDATNDATGQFAGNIQMYANWGYQTAESIGFEGPATIVLQGAGKETPVNDKYKPDYAELKIKIQPKDAKDAVKIKTSSDGFFKYTQGKVEKAADGTLAGDFVVPSTSTALELTAASKLQMGDRDSTQDYLITLSTVGYKKNTAGEWAIDNKWDEDKELPLAGKTTLTISCGKTTNTVDLVVVGLYVKDGELHYMTAQGEDLKDKAVTIGETTYYFDANGNRITDGKAKDENGNDVVIKDGKVQFGFITVTENGRERKYYVDENGVIKKGEFTVGDKTYYADPDTAYLVTDTFVTVGSALKYFDANGILKTGDGASFTEITSATPGDQKGTFEYCIGTDGVIKTSQLIPVGDKAVLVNQYGQRVTSQMATNGKYNDNGAVYTIDEQGFATLDKQFYFTGATEGEWKWNDGAPTVTVTMNYAADDGDTTPTKTETLLATLDPGQDETALYKSYTATITAAYVRKGATEKEVCTFTKKFDKDGNTAEYTVKDVDFVWPDAITPGTKPAVTAKIKYSVKEDGVAKPDETIDTAVEVSDAVREGKYDVFTATVKTLDTQNPTASETKKYNAETGKKAGGDPSASSGKISIKFAVDPETDDNGKAVFDQTGAKIMPAVIVTDEDRGVQLAETTDYTLVYGKNKTGNGTVTVKGKNNYKGQAVSIDFSIKALAQVENGFAVKKITKLATFTDGTTEGATSVVYNGKAWVPESIVVKDANGAEVTLKLQADGTYASEDETPKTTAISISNNVKKGTATVSALNAKGKFVKKTFKIAQVDLSKATAEELTFDPEDAVYAAKGAIPADLGVEYKGIALVNGMDYTVKYSYTSKTKDAGEKAGHFVITGKGNYSKKAAVTGDFDIEALELDDDLVSVSAYNKAAVSKVKATVSDGNRVVVPAKQLKVEVFKGDSETAMGAKEKLATGDEIKVVVTGVNDKNISGKAELTLKVGNNLGSVKAKADKNFTKYFTGESIELTEDDFGAGKIEVNGLKYGENFEIAGYQNNFKKGTMTVVLRGIPDGGYTGTKLVKVKVSPKTMEKAD